MINPELKLIKISSLADVAKGDILIWNPEYSFNHPTHTTLYLVVAVNSKSVSLYCLIDKIIYYDQDLITKNWGIFAKAKP